MVLSQRWPRWLAILGMGLTCFAVAACGSSKTTSSKTTSSPVPAANGGSSTTNVSAARSIVARYSSKPTPFPVDAPLAKKLPAGQKIAYLQCGTPYCALLAQLYGGATKVLGAPLDVVQGGTTSQSLQTALSSIATTKPAGLLVAGVNLSSLGSRLTQLTQSGVPAVSSAIFGAKAQGIDGDVNGTSAVALGGKLLAAWTIANVGAHAKVVWYTIPELGFAQTETSGFESEMSKDCPSCQVRVVDIPAAAIDTTAPNLVVSDLQSHPGDQVAMFASMEAAEGVPAALKTADLSVKIGGYAPTPENLQDIEAGRATVAVGLDAGVMAFTQVDETVRLATGQPLTSGEQSQTPVLQLLTKQNLKGNVSQGWSGYPNFIKQFGKLWSGTGGS